MVIKFQQIEKMNSFEEVRVKKIIINKITELLEEEVENSFFMLDNSFFVKANKYKCAVPEDYFLFFLITVIYGYNFEKNIDLENEIYIFRHSHLKFITLFKAAQLKTLFYKIYKIEEQWHQ